MNSHIAWIVHKWKSQKWFLVAMFVFTLGSSAVSIAYPYVFKEMIDLLREIVQYPDRFPDPIQDVHRIIMLFLVIGVAQFITGFYPAIRGWVNIRFEHILRMIYFKNITTKDYTFFHKFRTGDIVTRLTDDLSEFPKISWFLCSGIFRAVNSFSMIAFSLVVMFSINYQLTFLSIAPLPLMMAVFYFTSDKLYKNFELNQKAISNPLRERFDKDY
ncbi:MAG TPA: ABC transporter transmembrane domain-containing protein, partial [Candidatus Cloacimonadota bacterium]|nr:ABC transporter transmembrane domain-containing protein [Candidatus Cloacimonadota bacterium]